MASIKFRPHHFMCTLAFGGKGYSLGFIKNYKKIVQEISNDEDTIIEVVEYMDSICSPCPNKLDDILCKSQSKIVKLDNAHKEILAIKTGEFISWKKAKNRIKQNMSIEKFHSACDGCSWKQYGVCEQKLSDLINS
ncbi:MAG: DUF1284 domain-containing protein [Pseudomonadota bacterium]